MKKNYFLFFALLLTFKTNAQVSQVKYISSNAKTNSIASTSIGVVFGADDNPSIINIEPFISDGTEIGTFKIKEINTNNVLNNATSIYTSDNAEFVELNGYIYFAAGDTSNNVELWKTDGTSGGTILVKEINASTASSSFPTKLIVYNNKIYFNASNGLSGSNNGYELWTSDGTTAGTVLLKDIYPGTDSSFPSDFVIHDNKLFFTANNGPNGRELWVTDGTNAGTQMVKDFVVGSTGSNPQYTTVYNGDLYFRANGELYKSSGVIGNGGALRPIGNNPVNNPIGFNVLGNRLFFSAQVTASGRELWSTNGAPFGTSLFKDINVGSGDSSPQDFEISNGILFFKATDSSGNIELWKTDGLAVNTVAVTNTNLNPKKLTNYNNQVYFVGSNNRLWVSDGSLSGTNQIIGSYPNIINAYKMTVHNYELYFGAGNLYKYFDANLLSVSDLDIQQDIRLFPNPTTTHFTLNTNYNINDVKIHDVQGKLIQSFQGNNKQYNVEDLTSGIYFVSIKSDNGKITKKLIIN